MRNEVKPFDTQRSIQKAASATHQTVGIGDMMVLVTMIRSGVPYTDIEVISKRLNNPVQQILNLVGISQATYYKKKKDQQLLDRRSSELVLLIKELIDYGVEVFNGEEEKFQRWLKKPNASIGGSAPESLFDTVTGLGEVRHSLNRLEFGNLA